MKLFITNSNKRVYPSKKYGDYTKSYVAQGEIFNYQVSVYNDTEKLLYVDLSIESKFPSLIRLEECVPLAGHETGTFPQDLDGLNEYNVPDVLIPVSKAEVSPFSNKTFWVKVDTSKLSLFGDFTDIITVSGKYNEWGKAEEDWEKVSDKILIDYYVSKFAIKQKKTMDCLHWFYCDSISDFYKIPLWSDEFWPMCKKWMENYSAHGNTLIYLPLFTPSLDGVKKPIQLVKVGVIEGDKPENNKYTFDFTNAGKYVKLAKECGINKFEIVHLFTQWGVGFPIRIYKDTEFNLTPTNIKLYNKDIEINSIEDKNNLVVDIEGEATGPEYRNFLSQFFPAFKAFCEEYGIYDDLMFHVSDEPHLDHIDSYKKALDMLKELKPDIKLMDALSDREFADNTDIDMPIPSIGSEDKFDGIVHGTYFCCGPRGEYINRLLDTPLYKTRLLGSLMYKRDSKIFLHWGYNYYYISQTRNLIDPYKINDGGQYPNWAAGDTFVVYPGEDGPLDSIRWENFYDTLQDLDLLNNLNVPKDSPLLKDLISYKDFPRDPNFIWKLRKILLEGK